MTDAIKIRAMRRSELDFCVACVTGEGWLSETRYTFETFFAYDPDGCLIAEKAGKPVGMIVATAYHECGFLGELIVLPEYRGHGIGGRLMKQAMDYLRGRGCRSLYLDGDTPAVPLYERLGFKTICRSLRFLGEVTPSQTQSVQMMSAADLDRVLEIDRAAFGADRSFFLRRRFEHFPHLCLSSVVNGNVSGFILGQPGHGVVTVGPWYFDGDADRALDLVYSLAGQADTARLRVGVLESNQGAARMMRSLSVFRETEPSWRMVNGPDTGLGVTAGLIAVGSPAKG
jgi:ribosomal protein S18 acetylase RimI-like enzyme